MRHHTPVRSYTLESLESRRLISGTLLADRGFYLDGSSPARRAHVQDGDVVVYAGVTANNAPALWRTDGTPAGTYKLLDAKADWFISMGDYALFWIGTDLWRTDGSIAGTSYVQRIPHEITTGYVNTWPIRVGDTAYFLRGVTGLGTELYASDGTAAGTGLRFESLPGEASSIRSPIQAIGQDQALFTVLDDPTRPTLSTIYRIAPDDTITPIATLPGTVTDAVELNGKLIYSTNRVYAYDLQSSAIETLAPVPRGDPVRDETANWVVVGDRVLFVTLKSAGRLELRSTDGTAANSLRLETDIYTSVTTPLQVGLADRYAYFGSTVQITTDGTVGGTHRTSASSTGAIPAILGQDIYTVISNPGLVGANQQLQRLRAGTTVTETMEYLSELSNASHPIALANGTLLVSQYIGPLYAYRPPAPHGRATGPMFVDKNLNGVRDTNETLAVPERLQLRRTDGQPLPQGTIVTYANFVFTTVGLPDGEYEFYQTTSPNVAFTGPNPGRFTVERGVTLNVEIGFRYATAARGRVTNDLNADGTLSETGGVPNVRVFFDRNQNAAWDAGEPSGFSDASGYYAIPDIGTVSGQLWAERPQGWYRTFPFTRGSSLSPTFTSVVSKVVHFGLSQTAPPTRVEGTVGFWVEGSGVKTTLARSVYADSNDNGRRDPGEPSFESPRPGSTFTLVGLPPGTHKLRAEPLPSYVNDAATEITLVAGEFRYDAVVMLDRVTPSDRSISGRSWIDNDRNGVFDPVGDYPNVSRYAYVDGNGNRIRDPHELARLIAPDGTYLFEDVDPGVYPVRSERVSYFSFVAAPIGDESQLVTKPEGSAVANVDFRMHSLQTNAEAGIIAGRVYVDYDENGILDPGEPVTGSAKEVFLDLFGDGVMSGTRTYLNPYGSWLGFIEPDGRFDTTLLGPGTFPVRASLQPWERMDTVPIPVTAGSTTHQDLRILSIAPRAQFLHPIAVPRPLDSLVVRFSEPVTGFGSTRLVLFRDGVPVTNAGLQIGTTPLSDPREFRIHGLRNLTGTARTLTIGFASATIGDVKNAQGWPVVPNTTSSWTLYPAGDMNGDRVVNNADIAPFVAALTDPDAYRAAHPLLDPILGDVNADGVMNNGDIAAFVSLLTGGRPAGYPAPTSTRAPKAVFAEGPTVGDQVLETRAGRARAVAP